VNTDTPRATEAQPHRVRDREGSERRIREAAVTLFSQHGYDNVTVRMIAAEAQVNVALINRYFGSKFKLFAAMAAAESQTPDLSESDPQSLPRQLAEHAVRPRKDRPVLRALARTGSPEAREVLRNHLETSLVAQIASRLDAPDAVLRARTATAILLGASFARTIFTPTNLPDDDLTERLTEVLRTCLLD
jgi:AcrR family transcriptional regulator